MQPNIKPIRFGSETIYAPEVPYDEYEEFVELVRKADTEDEKQRRDAYLDVMARFALREDGSRRFVDRSDLAGLPGKILYYAVFEFVSTIFELNTVTQEDIEADRKN